MRTEFMVFLVAAIWVLVLALPSTSRREEQRAEAALCSELATQFRNGQVSLDDYLATRCKAGIIHYADSAE